MAQHQPGETGAAKDEVHQYRSTIRPEQSKSSAVIDEALCGYSIVERQMSLLLEQASKQQLTEITQ